MTYSAGGLIQATDYNGFISTNAGANVNDIWATGSGDTGYGQSARSTVAAAGTITATQWATLVNTISSIATHQGTTITSRTAPVTGNKITILSNLATDLTNLTTNRLNAATSGAQYTAWTGTSSKDTATGSGSNTWTITFSHTVSWASAAAMRYFFNAGGRIKWETSKTSTGTLADAEWNDLANTLCGDIYITSGTATQTIAGGSYTGTTKVGGTGTPNTLATTVGFYDLTTTDTLIYRQYADTAPYTGQYIAINAKLNAAPGSSTVMTLTTTWVDPGGSGAGSSDNISGGTATTGITFGTSPATVVTYFPPESTNISNSWGTPTVAATVA